MVDTCFFGKGNMGNPKSWSRVEDHSFGNWRTHPNHPDVFAALIVGLLAKLFRLFLCKSFFGSCQTRMARTNDKLLFQSCNCDQFIGLVCHDARYVCSDSSIGLSLQRITSTSWLWAFSSCQSMGEHQQGWVVGPTISDTGDWIWASNCFRGGVEYDLFHTMNIQQIDGNKTRIGPFQMFCTKQRKQ